MVHGYLPFRGVVKDPDAKGNNDKEEAPIRELKDEIMGHKYLVDQDLSPGC